MDFDLFYIFSLVVSILSIVLLILLLKIKEKFTSSKLFLVSWNLSLLFCFISIIYISGETYYRFYVDTTDSFAINKLSQRWLKRHYQSNKQSLRDNVDYNSKIAPGKRRLTIIGDSFTAGHGVKEVDDRFGNLLKKEMINTEVHVIAANGSSTGSQMITLNKLKDQGYEFDIVLLAYCLNDIDYFIPKSKKTYDKVHQFNQNLNYIERNSYFINFLAFRLFAIMNPELQDYTNFVLEAYDNEVWDSQKLALRDMSILVQNQEAYFIVTTFPFLQKEISDYAFLSVHNQLDEFWSELQIPHIDLLPTYEPYLGEALTVNQYDAHPNEFAHQLAAKAINNYFKSN